MEFYFYIVYLIEIIFSTYMTLFLLYLTYKFTDKENQLMLDPFLNRKVSTVTYLENQKLYTKAKADKNFDEKNKEHREQLRWKAE